MNLHQRWKFYHSYSRLEQEITSIWRKGTLFNIVIVVGPFNVIKPLKFQITL